MSTEMTAANKSGAQTEEDNSLEEMGYKQELYRGFNAFMSFSFCFTAVACVSSISILFNYGLATGGPAVMVWGWVIASFFTMLVGAAMAEICSTFPSAGSVYHWAGMLASPSAAPFACFITGWFNLFGNAAGDASFGYGFAQVVAAAVSLGSDGQTTLTTGQTVLVAIGVCFVWTLLNVLRVDQQGWLNNLAAVWQVFSTLAIIITVLSTAPSSASASDVFQKTINNTGLDQTNAMVYVALMGLLFSLFSFSGYEAGAHMAEETHNSRSSAPWGIVATCISTALTGIVYILGLLFAAPNLDDITADPNSLSVVNIYRQCAGKGGGLVLTSFLITNLFFAGMSSLTVTSRICFAMVRDGALPFSPFFYHVSSFTQTPIRSVVLVFVFDALLLLLPLASQAAFTAITSITTIGFQISYGIPIFLRVTSSRDTFQQHDFNLGSWSVVIHSVACTWLFFTSILFFWPSNYPIDADHISNMNWTVVVVGGIMTWCLLYWVFSARHFFLGPKRKDAPQTAPSESI